MLSVDGLDYGFPGRTVGRDLRFALAAGETMCVLGPNGVGKTTLFRTLLGLLPPRRGRVLLDGTPLEALSRTQIARVAGYVPQAHAGYFAFTVLEFVLMGRSAHLSAIATPGRTDREIAREVLESLGIGALAERPITAVSGGERQLVMIARALAQRPRLLVLDEPTASLDFGNRARVLERIVELSSSGIAVLFSTHDPDHAFAAANRALLLADGGQLAVGAPQDVIRPDTLRRLYRIDVRVLALDDGSRVCVPTARGMRDVAR